MRYSYLCLTFLFFLGCSHHKEIIRTLSSISKNKAPQSCNIEVDLFMNHNFFFQALTKDLSGNKISSYDLSNQEIDIINSFYANSEKLDPDMRFFDPVLKVRFPTPGNELASLNSIMTFNVPVSKKRGFANLKMKAFHQFSSREPNSYATLFMSSIQNIVFKKKVEADFESNFFKEIKKVSPYHFFETVRIDQQMDKGLNSFVLKEYMQGAKVRPADIRASFEKKSPMAAGEWVREKIESLIPDAD